MPESTWQDMPEMGRPVPVYATVITNPMAGAFGADDDSSGKPSSRPTAAIGALIDEASRRQGLAPAIVTALMRAESGFRANARSAAGAIGLMQVMPATAARFGVASASGLLDPAVNIDVGTRYLRELCARFGDLPLVLAAYNAGEGAVMRYGMRIPPFPETQDYVRRILTYLDTQSGGC